MRHAGARTPAQVGDEDIGSSTLSNTDPGSFGELEVHACWINRGTMVIHDTVLVCQAERNALGQDDGVALACDNRSTNSHSVVNRRMAKTTRYVYKTK